LLQLRQVGVPGIGQARQVLAVGERGVDLRQLLQAALLVVFQLLQVLLAFGDLLLGLLPALRCAASSCSRRARLSWAAKAWRRRGAFSLCWAWLSASA